MSLDDHLLCASAPLSLQLLRELQGGRVLLVCSAASLVASPRSSQHAPRRAERREASVDRSRSRSSSVSRSSDRGRIVEPILDRTALVTVTVVLALALLTVRG